MGEFQIGDRVHTVRETVSMYGYNIPDGAEGAIAKRSVYENDGYVHVEFDTLAPLLVRKSDLALISSPEFPRVISFSDIRVGDHVRFTRTFSETDRVVKEFVVDNLTAGAWVDSSAESGETVYADFANQSVIELLNRDEPVEIGDVVKDSSVLPLGTVVNGQEGLSHPFFRAESGWVSTYGHAFPVEFVNGFTIAYLPESGK